MTRIAITAILVTLCPLLARAENVKAYPGHACLTHEETVQRVGSAFVNTDTAAHNVACPIAREYINRDLQRAVVVVVDRNPNADVSCTLKMKTEDGSDFDSQTETSSGSGAAAQILTFGTLFSADQGHLQLYCTLPGTSGGLQSSVVSYRINEDAP